MRFCQFCTAPIRDGQQYFEVWTPYHQYSCMECHKARRGKE